MTTDNMRVWNAVKQPPSSALKPIQAGRLRGKSDINPQWRYQVMTEQFGICGVGWKFEIKRTWSEPAPGNQMFAFAEIWLYTFKGDSWSDPIPATGGSMLITQESGGLHASDEGYKMAITDALGVAMKMLGVAADVYAGLWDGSKYQELPGSTSLPKPASQTPPKEHWCKEHNTAFFMKGKMKAYAHPIGDTGEWCHEHSKEPEAPKESAATGQASTSSAGPTETKPKRDPATVKTGTELFKACKEDFGLAPQEVLKELGVSATTDLADMNKAYATIAAVRR